MRGANKDQANIQCTAIDYEEKNVNYYYLPTRLRRFNIIQTFGPVSLVLHGRMELMEMILDVFLEICYDPCFFNAKYPQTVYLVICISPDFFWCDINCVF